MEEKAEVNGKSYKNVIIGVILIIVIGAAYNNYRKNGGIFDSSPTDDKLKSYCKEFIEEYYPQNSGIKFGRVYELENDIRRFQVFIRTENIVTINEEVLFELTKSGKILDIYQTLEVSPFVERIRMMPLVITSFNSEHFGEY